MQNPKWIFLIVFTEEEVLRKPTTFPFQPRGVGRVRKRKKRPYPSKTRKKPV